MKLTPDEVARRLAARPRRVAAPPGRDPGRDPGQAARPAAVLVALLDRGGEPCVLLTRRADAMRNHGGQYAFPGGTRDAGDADAVATALREAWEEVGVAREDARVLGLLSDHPVITGFVVTPVVCWLPHPYRYTPNAREVALVVELPLAAFLVPPRARTLRFQGVRRIVLAFEVEGHVIWGATAAILRDLATALA